MTERSTSSHCSVATCDDLPDLIQGLVGRCEINEHMFDNADMSLALVFGQSLWSRLDEMADQHERLAGEARGSERVIYSHVAGIIRGIMRDLQNAGSRP